MAFTGVRTIGLKAVQTKLVLAAPHILEHNRVLITEMLNLVKPTVIAQTPLGPGHFGYHLRDSYLTEVKSEGVVSSGVLKAPAQGYWREYGTRGGFHRSGTTAGYAFAFERMNKLAHPGDGEPAGMFAHKALAGVRKMISLFYGGQAAWWKLGSLR